MPERPPPRDGAATSKQSLQAAQRSLEQEVATTKAALAAIMAAQAAARSGSQAAAASSTGPGELLFLGGATATPQRVKGTAGPVPATPKGKNLPPLSEMPTPVTGLAQFLMEDPHVAAAELALGAGHRTPVMATAEAPAEAQAQGYRVPMVPSCPMAGTRGLPNLQWQVRAAPQEAAEIAGLRAQLRQEREENNALAARSQTLQREVECAREEVAALKRKAQTLQRKLEEPEDDENRLRKERNQLQDEVADLKAAGRSAVAPPPPELAQQAANHKAERERVHGVLASAAQAAASVQGQINALRARLQAAKGSAKGSKGSRASEGGKGGRTAAAAPPAATASTASASDRPRVLKRKALKSKDANRGASSSATAAAETPATNANATGAKVKWQRKWKRSAHDL